MTEGDFDERRAERAAQASAAREASDPIRQAVRTTLRDGEQLVTWFACSSSRSLRRVFALPDRWWVALTPVHVVVAITTERLLLFHKRRGAGSTRAAIASYGYRVVQVPRWRRHELVLLQASQLANVIAPEFHDRRSKWDGRELGWFKLNVRDEILKFSLRERLDARWLLQMTGAWCMLVGFLLVFLDAWRLWLIAAGVVLLGVGRGLMKLRGGPSKHPIECLQRALDHSVDSTTSDSRDRAYIESPGGQTDDSGHVAAPAFESTPLRRQPVPRWRVLMFVGYFLIGGLGWYKGERGSESGVAARTIEAVLVAAGTLTVTATVVWRVRRWRTRAQDFKARYRDAYLSVLAVMPALSFCLVPLLGPGANRRLLRLRPRGVGLPVVLLLGDRRIEVVRARANPSSTRAPADGAQAVGQFPDLYLTIRHARTLSRDFLARLRATAGDASQSIRRHGPVFRHDGGGEQVKRWRRPGWPRRSRSRGNDRCSG
jgi:hypothetical protein